MGAIDNFLRRLGFAKLDQYGLILTADDRVISMRHAVLDDGLGAKIVGWREGDLAAMELEHWGAPKAATAKPIAAPASLHKLPPAPPPAARLIAPAAPVAPPAPAAKAAPAAARPLPGVSQVVAPAPAPAPVVAPIEEPGEDEWEWEIAMARARAAEVEETRVDLLGASAVIAAAANQRKTNPGMAVTAKSPPKLPDPLPPWPETEPFNEAWAESEGAPHVMSVLQKKLAVARSTPARGQSAVATPQQRTVIPVPELPAAADPRTVRPPVHVPSQPRGRMARGTGSKREDTVRTQAAPPANDDRTSPYIELPSEVKPSGFAHTKRVAARQR